MHRGTAGAPGAARVVSSQHKGISLQRFSGDKLACDYALCSRTWGVSPLKPGGGFWGDLPLPTLGLEASGQHVEAWNLRPPYRETLACAKTCCKGTIVGFPSTPGRTHLRGRCPGTRADRGMPERDDGTRPEINQALASLPETRRVEDGRGPTSAGRAVALRRCIAALWHCRDEQ